jgi:hypothetical protein
MIGVLGRGTRANSWICVRSVECDEDRAFCGLYFPVCECEQMLEARNLYDIMSVIHSKVLRGSPLARHAIIFIHRRILDQQIL